MSKCGVSVTPVLPRKDQMAKGLTVLSVENVKPKEARYEIPDSGSGLYLVVQPSGAKSFALRYRMGSRPRKLTLGAYPKLGLVEARKLARSAVQAVAEGNDPADKKAARRASDLPQTIDELADCSSSASQEELPSADLARDGTHPWT